MIWQELTQEAKNAWIAEHIMGLQVEHWTEETYKDADPAYNYVLGYRVINGPGHIAYSEPVPKYTKDWNAAWQVLCKMVEQHCVRQEDGDYDEVWQRFTAEMDLLHPLEPNIYPWICAWTPELLARAAYLAVTGEES